MVPIPIPVRAKKGYEIIHNVTLYGKRREPEKTCHWHLKDFQFVKKRYGVDPFAVSPEIPKLPKPAANKPCSEEEKKRADTSRFPFSKERWTSVDIVYGVQKKNETSPNKRKAKTGE